MKKIFVLLILIAASAACSSAQLVYTAPQTVQVRLFNAVAVAGVSTNPQNIAQSVHYLTYTTSLTTPVIRLRLEGSNDGTTYFPISEDATDPGSGGVFAFGYYPFVRANLLTISAGTLTAFYAGTSTTAGAPAGVFNAGQLSKKIIFSNGNPQASTNVDFAPPYGNTGGFIYISASGTWGPNCALNVQAIDGPILFGNALSVAVPNAQLAQYAIPAIPASRIRVAWTACGGAQTTFNLTYFFYPVTTTSTGSASAIVQGTLQPVSLGANPVYLNTQTTSAADTAVTTSIALETGMRVFLFSVSARCSAGTSTLTVKNGVAGTTIWSSATGEVGTTTFRFQWNPGLASDVSNGMDVVLGTCGAANTGTLSVQISRQ